MIFAPPFRYPTKPPAGTPINWSHPITNGLVAYWPFNEGAGAPRDIAHNRNHTAITGNITWVQGPGGLGMDFPNAGTGTDYLSVTTEGLASLTNTVTLMAIVEPDSLNFYQAILETRGGGAGLEGIIISGDAATPVTAAWDNTFDEYDFASGLTLTIGKVYIVGASITPANITVYVGQFGGSFGSAVNNVDTNSVRDLNNPWYFGRDPLDVTEEWDGRIYGAAFWERPLSENEWRTLHANPYALFARPAPYQTYYQNAAIPVTPNIEMTGAFFSG